MTETPNALEGINVIDLTQFASGPICTLSLAQMGANIIKIERPGVGEQGRPRGGGQNMLWAILHANKKSITLDLKSDKGKEILREMIKKCDVVIENFAPNTFERLGFSYDVIKSLNERCIMCQIKGYDDNSPYAGFPAMDGPVQATGTLASQNGMLDGPPLISSVGLADDPSGHYALSSVLAALYQREKTGRGQQLRINMQEVCISTSRMSFVEQKVMPKRGGAMRFAGRNAPRNMYPTKPRYEGDENNYVFILVRDTPKQIMWQKFCEAIDRMDMFEDPKYADGPTRLDNVEALEAEVIKWTSALDKDEVMRIMCDKMIPCGATLTIEDVVNTKEMYESNFLQTIDHPSLGEITLVGSAYRMSDTYVPVKPAPDLGQHNDEIYKTFMGMSDAEIQILKTEGVI